MVNKTNLFTKFNVNVFLKITDAFTVRKPEKIYEPSAVAYIRNSVACSEKLFKAHKLAKIHLQN